MTDHAKNRLVEALEEIASGNCPPPWPMTDTGLSDYRQHVAKQALASYAAAQPRQAAGLAGKLNRSTFDLAGFTAALQRSADARGKTMKEVSAETGVSETTLSRMKSGERAPDAASLASLSAWAGLNPANFCTPTAPSAPAAQAGESSIDHWQQRGYLGSPEEWREACRLYRSRCSEQDVAAMAKLHAYIEDGLLVATRPTQPPASQDVAPAAGQAGVGQELVAASHPPQPEARAPLSDEEIDLIANDGMRNAAGGIYATCVYEFARAVERYHGIGVHLGEGE